MDDVSRLDELAVYGEQLGRMILNDQVDSVQGISLKKPAIPQG
jgi:hypothetical protein